MSLKRADRLRKSAEYVAVRREGRSWTDANLVLSARRADSDRARFGFTVSKRIGNAVTRNRIRRRLKAAAADAPAKPGWDIVIIARDRARDADYWTLRRSLNRLLGRARIRRRKRRTGRGHE